MPISHTIEGRVVHLAWSGVITNADLAAIGALMPRLVKELGFVPHVLNTYDGVIGADLDPDAIYAQSMQRRQHPIPPQAKSALVAATPVVLSMARVFQAMNRDPRLQMEIFSSEAEARAWLAEW